MFLKIFIILVSLFQISTSAGAVDSKNRVEELFIWKVSDELKLSVPEEKSFSILIKGLNQRRTLVNENLQDIVKQLAESRTTKEKEKLLLEQKRQLRNYNELSLEEADRVQKLFGIDRAAQYFVIKSDLTNRLKTVLASPEKTTAPTAPPAAPVKLGPPQVIEEK